MAHGIRAEQPSDGDVHGDDDRGSQQEWRRIDVADGEVEAQPRGDQQAGDPDGRIGSGPEEACPETGPGAAGHGVDFTQVTGLRSSEKVHVTGSAAVAC